jgi:hypothetical protein
LVVIRLLTPFNPLCFLAPLDPEDALRALLAVDPDAEPAVQDEPVDAE